MLENKNHRGGGRYNTGVMIGQGPVFIREHTHLIGKEELSGHCPDSFAHLRTYKMMFAYPGKQDFTVFLLGCETAGAQQYHDKGE